MPSRWVGRLAVESFQIGGPQKLAVRHMDFMVLAAGRSVVVYFLPRGSSLGIVALFFTGFFVYGPQAAWRVLLWRWGFAVEVFAKGG